MQTLTSEQAMACIDDMAANGPLVLCGLIDAWDGFRTTGMLVGDAGGFEQAVWTGRGIDDVEYFLTSKGTLGAKSYHHDGTNVWTVRAVSAAGRRWLDGKIWNGHVSNRLGFHLVNVKAYTKTAKARRPEQEDD